LALEAELKSLSKKVTKKKVTIAPGTKKGTGGTPGKGKGQKEKPDWFTKTPKKEDFQKPRMWNDKSWYYCHPDTGGKWDGQYRRHKPSQCEGKAHTFVPTDKKDNKCPSTAQDSRKLKLLKARSAVAKEDRSAKLEDSQE
jgi:hypothetical protein